MKYLSYNEIFEQSETWKGTYNKVKIETKKIIEDLKNYKADRIIIAACGSSYWGALSGGRVLQKETGIHVDVITSGDLFINYTDLIRKDERIILFTPSRSGKTSETISAVKAVKSYCETIVLNIGCAQEASLNDLADFNIIISNVHELSVCQTRSFTNLYIAQLVIAATWSDNSKIFSDLESAINGGSEFISNSEAIIKKISADSVWADGFVLANGNLYGIGCEGALILQEMSQTPMDYYQAFEYRHGPIVLTTEQSLVVIMETSTGSTYEKQLIPEIKEKDAKVLMLGDVESSNEEIEFDYFVSINNKWDDSIKGIYYITVLQMLAYYKALGKNLNPDQPSGLVQWISIK